MEYRGIIASWNDERGFGFARPAGGGTQLFFHISDYQGATRPAQGDAVHFEIGMGRDGKPAARKVRPSFSRLAQSPDQPAHFTRNSNRVWLAIAVLGLAFAAAILDHLPIGVPLLYLGMGAASYGLYALDKGAAQSGGWRVSERALHLLDLMFGIVGGLIAQQVLRHKTSKQSFALVSVVIAFGHIALLSAVLLGHFAPDGLFEALAI